MAPSSRLLLLVSSSEPTRELDTELLSNLGLTVVRAHTSSQILEWLNTSRVEGVLLCLPDPGWSYDQIQLILRQRNSRIPLVCYEPDGSSANAATALASGVAHYVTGPDPESRIAEIFTVTTEAWRQTLVGDSTEMQQVVELISLVADRRSTVLITGETGTGKEVVARAIHAAGGRAKGPFIAVNCAALPENLVEAELFGHTKGAFTGAAGARAGRFEEANGGTILLDEISELPLNCQAKLLRVLQEREVQRLGSSETIKVDVRVIAASNTDLGGEVRRRKFREDLLYRLQVVPMRIPALRERLADVPELANHFMTQVCKREGLRPKSLAPEAMARLAGHNWPGNVRQLEHAIESAVILSGNRTLLQAYDFELITGRASTDEHESTIELPSGGVDFENYINRIQHDLLWQALRRSGGNKAKAADLLGMKRTTLISKIKALGCVAS